MNDYPSHTHAWAQSDRYAISKSFVNNGLNLFEPETYLLNPQFPDFWETPQKESITSVDFPIHDYIPAVFMKITGIDSPWVVRLYNLLYSLLGLLFLYKLALLFLKNEIKALFVLIFAATSPVFLFYQNSFIPTIPSLANAIISIYFYAKYSRDNKNKSFNASILFGTLAGLSRFTFVIPLIAILSVEFLRIIRKKSALKSKLIPVLISISLFIGYYVYNKYLRSLYGSSFLDTLMNVDNFEAFITKLKLSTSNWGTQYLSSIHYYILIIAVLSAILFYFFKKQKITNELKRFNLFILVLFIGNAFFLIAMIHQFILHDYYFLDSFYLPFVLLVIPILAFIPINENKVTKIISICFLIGVGFIFTKLGVESQKERYTYKFWDDGDQLIENYTCADEALTSLGYDNNSKVLIFESFAPNLPLLTMNRKGFAVMANRIPMIDKALTWDYDAIVIQNESFVSKILPVYPKIINKITRIWGNDKISICTLKENKFDFSQFFEFKTKKSLVESTLSFEGENNSEWLNIKTTSAEKFSGDSSIIQLPNMKDGPVFAKHLNDFFKTKKTVVFEGDFKFISEPKATITICVSNPAGQNDYYKVKDLKNLIITRNEWKTVRLILNIPKIDNEKSEFKLFLNNETEMPFLMDDLSLKIFETDF